MMDIFSK